MKGCQYLCDDRPALLQSRGPLQYLLCGVSLKKKRDLRLISVYGGVAGVVG